MSIKFPRKRYGTASKKKNWKGVTTFIDIPALWSPSSSPPSSAWWCILALPSIPCPCTASPRNAGLDKRKRFLFSSPSDQQIICCRWRFQLKIVKQIGRITFNVFWKLAVNVFICFQSFLVVSCKEKRKGLGKFITSLFRKRQTKSMVNGC